MPAPDQVPQNLGQEVPQYFCAGVQGAAHENGCTMLSFATFDPSPDHASRTYRTNVRIVMPTLAVKMLRDFLSETLVAPPQPSIPMPTQSH